MSSVSFLFYNTHLFGNTLPGTFIGGQGFHDQIRADAIVNFIVGTNADITCLCEVWDESMKTDVITKLSNLYPFQCSTPPPTFFSLVGNGLLILSKFKICDFKFSAFQSLSGMDYFSNKGVLMVLLELNESLHFRIFLTHNQALPDPTNIRQENMLFVSQLIKQYNPELPGVVLGDLNIYPDEDCYLRMMEYLEEFQHTDITDPTYDVTDNQLGKRFSDTFDRTGKLDYILCTKKDWTVESWKVIKDWIVNGIECSDHYPIFSILSIQQEK